MWGTVITIQVPSGMVSDDLFDSTCNEAETFFHEIDQRFSTYIDTSEVSRVRNGSLEMLDASGLVQEVAERCLELRSLTRGAFDPWAVPGGFDPSGFVKGWAAQESLKFFDQEIFPHLQIDAGGDLVMRGGYAVETPWKVGIRHPDDRSEISGVVEIFDGAVASSGTYERGAHIFDPRFGAPAVGSRAATVVGPDAAVADALATALIVDGRDSVNWLGVEEFRAYSFWAVDKSGDLAWSYQYSEATPR